MNKKIEIKTTENIYSFSIDTLENFLKLYNIINKNEVIVKVRMDDEESFMHPSTSSIMELYKNKYL